jgi:hypothetical protein
MCKKTKHTIFLWLDQKVYHRSMIRYFLYFCASRPNIMLVVNTCEIFFKPHINFKMQLVPVKEVFPYLVHITNFYLYDEITYSTQTS